MSHPKTAFQLYIERLNEEEKDTVKPYRLDGQNDGSFKDFTPKSTLGNNGAAPTAWSLKGQASPEGGHPKDSSVMAFASTSETTPLSGQGTEANGAPAVKVPTPLVPTVPPVQVAPPVPEI